MQDKGRPEYGKLYALTGGANDPCISNGNTWAESEVKQEEVCDTCSKKSDCAIYNNGSRARQCEYYEVVPAKVRTSRFGCVNCLWAGVECKRGSKYRPDENENCDNYTYYD